MDREYVWGAECGQCGARILRAEVGPGATLDEWLGVHKELICPSATPQAAFWPPARTRLLE